MMMKNQLIKEFVDNYKVADKSMHTINQYEAILKNFFCFIEKNYFSISIQHLKKIDHVCIKAYLSFLMSNGNKAISRKKKLSVLKTFFKYLQSVNKILVNPVDNNIKIKTGRKLPVYFTLEECKRILELIGTRNHLRNETIILLFLNTGMRLSELVSLNVRNINGKSITIKGKGNKERKIYLSEPMMQKLHDYINSGSEIKNEALFLSERDKRISNSAVQQMIKEVLLTAQLPGSVHTLRHSFATQQLLSKNANLKQLQELLGHADLSTTAIYTHVANPELQEIANNNPFNVLIK
jgi:site-specific recombinase XerD